MSNGPNTDSAAAVDYSWAEYLHYMEGGSDLLEIAPKKPAPSVPETLGWGLAACVALTVAALLLSRAPLWPFTLASGRHPLEPVMLAIVLGMVWCNVRPLSKVSQPGIKFAVKKLLPLGIVLLGARLNFLAVLQIGLKGLALSVLEIILALGLLWFLTWRLRLPEKLGLLLGVGTAICGGTAIVATAPVIEAEEKDVVFSVATVTLLGLVSMFLLPILGQMLSLPSKAFGVWAGLAIHQTPQVVAAGFAFSPEAGETATIIKLARVCLLAPVVFLIGVWYARRRAQSASSSTTGRVRYRKMFPLFVVGFLGMALLRTLGFLPELTVQMPHAAVGGPVNFDLSVAAGAQRVSEWCIVASMAGVGLETKFAALRQTGLKPLAAGALAALCITVVILALIHYLGVGQ